MQVQPTISGLMFSYCCGNIYETCHAYIWFVIEEKQTVYCEIVKLLELAACQQECRERQRQSGILIPV